MVIKQYKFFTKDQERIFNGLKEIGPTLANFYADAVAVMQPDCFIASKANFIAHMAREIDGGLRDVFAPLELKNEKLKIAGKDRGHFASILAAMDKNDPNDELANEWFKIATQFPSIAHRHEIHGPSRAVEDILDLWARYEQILLTLIGSFYALIQRLDRFISMTEAPVELPPKSLPALGNMLKNEKQSAYFFSKLTQPGWLPGLQAEGYFEIDNAPVPTGEPATIIEWWPLRYLLNIARIKSSGQETAIKNIVDNILNAYQEDKLHLHQYSIAILSDIITELDLYGFSENEQKFYNKVAANSQDHFLFFTQTLLDKITPKLIAANDNQGLLKLLAFVFGYSTYLEPQIDIFDGIESEPITRRKPNLDEFQINHFIHQFGAQLISIIGKESIGLVADNLKSLEGIGNFESSIWGMTSIEDTDQTVFNNSWERSLSNFIRDYAASLPPVELSSFLNSWILMDDSILQRLAFHLIRAKYDEQSSIWWQYIQTSTERPYIHEPYILLRETSSAYNDNQLQMVLDWIERTTKVNQWEGQTEENALANRHYNVRRWLSALSATDPKTKAILDEKNKEYNALNDWKIDHPEYDSYSTSSYGPDMPIELHAFTRLDIDEQIAFIKSYTPSSAHLTGDEGLSLVLTQNAAQNPEKYLFSLDKFLPLSSIYAQGLLEGLKEAITAGKLTSFMSVVSFATNKIEESSFLAEPTTNYKGQRGLIFKIVDLVRAIASTESLEITEEQIKTILRLVITLLENADYKDDSDNISRGYIDHSLNSLSGRLHMALLDVCNLFSRKFTTPKNKVKWPEQAKAYFTRHLNRTGNSDKDYSIILGSRLPLILYLDKDWVMQHIEQIFDPKNEQHFEYTFGSALSPLYQPDQSFYKLLKAGNYFELALDRYTESDGRLTRVMNYGLLEWQAWSVPINDPNAILNIVLEKKIPGQFMELIKVVDRNKFVSNDLVKSLWQKILDATGSEARFNDVCSYLLILGDHTNELDKDTCNLILSTIDKISAESQSSTILTRKIYKIADTNLPMAADIIIRLFEKDIAKPYFETELQGFTRKLFTNGLKEKANQLCILVSDGGSFALKDIYDEFNR